MWVPELECRIGLPTACAPGALVRGTATWQCGRWRVAAGDVWANRPHQVKGLVNSPQGACLSSQLRCGWSHTQLLGTTALARPAAPTSMTLHHFIRHTPTIPFWPLRQLVPNKQRTSHPTLACALNIRWFRQPLHRTAAGSRFVAATTAFFTLLSAVFLLLQKRHLVITPALQALPAVAPFLAPSL